ncbi:hypothetical protein [Asticcacaulis sp.]|uniref:hypothetical protein n=1 Tax=Asticcacaulis sp. TaxID=1872648 RepID=UPI003F7C679A
MILFASSDATDLRSFSEAFFETVGTDFEERQSANCLDEIYFRGSKDGLRFSIWKSDEDDLQQWQFLIEISSHNPNLEDLTLKLNRLKNNCFEFWQIYHFGKKNQSLIKL